MAFSRIAPTMDTFLDLYCEQSDYYHLLLKLI